MKPFFAIVRSIRNRMVYRSKNGSFINSHLVVGMVGKRIGTTILGPKIPELVRYSWEADNDLGFLFFLFFFPNCISFSAEEKGSPISCQKTQFFFPPSFSFSLPFWSSQPTCQISHYNFFRTISQEEEKNKKKFFWEKRSCFLSRCELALQTSLFFFLPPV